MGERYSESPDDLGNICLVVCCSTDRDRHAYHALATLTVDDGKLKKAKRNVSTCMLERGRVQSTMPAPVFPCAILGTGSSPRCKVVECSYSTQIPST